MISWVVFCTDKPPLMDLQYFLDFSGPRAWAPVHNDLPFGAAPNMASAYPALHINFMGPKLYVNTTPVRVFLYIPNYTCKNICSY